MLNVLQPQPTRWYEFWLHLGKLYTHDEMLSRFDHVGDTWQERPVVKATTCGKPRGYCDACERIAEVTER